MVLYAENAIIPINVSETMNGPEIVGELQTKNEYLTLDPCLRLKVSGQDPCPSVC